MILGLPGVGRAALLGRAATLRAPVLVSANALAIRRPDRHGTPTFAGFRTAGLSSLDGLEAHLDSAGFVAMVHYRGFDWSVAQYVALGAAYPWRWFAAMDACVEQEIAPQRSIVQDRISWTIALNIACRREARAQGCLDRLMPVIQGARPHDYLRCLDGMPWAADGAILGVGSMCRRAMRGPDGVLAAIEAIDRALGAAPARLHLFGVKSDAAEALRGHPRIASADSQAYGVRARRLAMELGCSKSEAFVADVMDSWYRRQRSRLEQPGRTPITSVELALGDPLPRDPIEAAMEEAREEMRRLMEAGEIEWSDLTDGRVAEWALMD